MSVFDQGFLLGDAVYEVLRTVGGRPFQLPRHLDRLARSAARLGLPLGDDRALFEAELRALIPAAGGGALSVRLVRSRGGRPELAEWAPPLRLLIAQPLQTPPDALYVQGAPAIFCRPQAPAGDPHAKTGQRARALLAQAEARARGAHEALLLGEGDEVLEGASSSLFMVAGGALITPPLAAGVLEGITRALTLELAAQAGLRTLELRLNQAALAAADEVFITSTSRGLLPITRLDGQPVADQRPGPIYQRLRADFRALLDAAAAAPS